MKKIFIIMLLLTSMLLTAGFAPAEKSYWEDMKAIYEWDVMEGDMELDLLISVPNIDAHYKINVYSQSNLKDFVSFMEIDVVDMLESNEIPTIRLYTQGSDIYINRDAVVALLPVIGLEDILEFEEEYLLFKSDQNIQMNSNFLQDMIVFLEQMDLGIDFGMTKDGDTYTLSLDSDEILDLLVSYLKHFITNIDNLPEGIMPEEINISEEEKEQILDQYNNMVVPQIQMMKELVKGSYYNQVSTFTEDSYFEEAELFITSPMTQDMMIKMNIVSNTKKSITSDINFPTSVFVITDEDLTNLMISRFESETQQSLVYLMDLRGNYMHFGSEGIEEGKINVTVKNGRTYITKEIALELFGVNIDDTQDESMIWIRELNNYGYFVDWNSPQQIIEIYR